MLEITGATNVSTTTISAIKKRASGGARRRARRGGENILWKRVTENFDAAVKRFAANPEMASPVTRLVFFKHLTVEQGMAARRYRDVVRRFERYHVAQAQRAARSQQFEPVRGADQEIERHTRAGTIDEYEAKARKARRQYQKAMKLLDRFADPVTGRNTAKDVLDELVLSDKEPPAEWRQNLALVLQAFAREFGVMERR